MVAARQNARDARDTKARSGVRLEEVAFYFDAVERDRLDATGISRRAGEVLALRQELLSLPDPEFDAAIKTLRSLVRGSANAGSGGEPEGRRQQGKALFDQVRGGRGGAGAGGGKVSPT